jgi:hypothetical protein
MHNGQPTGAQDLTTTEDGSYFINGIGQSNDTQLEDVVREPDATWVIPTDNEWYKAAFHKNDGVTGNYWNFGTGSDFKPNNDLIDPDPGNHATFHEGFFGDPEGFTIGAPYYRTEGGAHENSSSAYGTFDQAGNMMEFTETVPESDIRRMRDGSWKANSGLMGSSQIDDVMHSSDQFDDLGFRLVNVATAPALLSAVSRRTHGAAGAFDIALNVNGAAVFDPRHNTAGAPQVIVMYDTPPADPGCGGISIVNGSCTATSVSGNSLVIDTTLDKNVCLEVTVGGDTVKVLTQEGDVTSDAAVNLLDLNAIKLELFQTVTAANFQSDVNADGSINLLDLNVTKINLFEPRPACP